MKTVMKSIALAIVLTVLGSGCVSVIEHWDGEAWYPYNATEDAFCNFLGIWWYEPTCQEDVGAISLIKRTYPLWILDFPLEVVADTVCLPYDAFYLQGHPEQKTEKRGLVK